MEKVVINEYGTEIDYEAAVMMMDDDIREEIHMKLAPCTDQEFFDAYVKAHADKYGDEDWQPAQENPVMQGIIKDKKEWYNTTLFNYSHFTDIFILLIIIYLPGGWCGYIPNFSHSLTAFLTSL